MPDSSAAMRIVLAHKYFYEGAGTATYLFQVMSQLAGRGHECIPFTVAFNGAVPSAYAGYYVSPLVNASQTHLRDMKLTPGLMARLLARATWSLETYQKALRLCDEVKPDIAYVHNLQGYMSPSAISAFSKRGVPVIMRISDVSLLCPGTDGWLDGQICIHCARSGPWRGLRRRCHKGSLASTAARVFSMQAHRLLRVYDGVDRFITPSRFMAELIGSGGFGHKPVSCIPSFYPAPSEPPTPTEDDYILYFGRISPEKGLRTLLRAFARIGAPGRLLLAGADVDGHTDTLRSLAADLAVGESVEFLGPQLRDALDDVIAGSLFTVVPSEWAENFPMSVLEAFAHGKPVIGTEVGGIPEQITPDVGALVPPGDVDALAQAMQSLIEDEERRRKAGRAAWQRVREEYSPGTHCERLLALFGEALDGAPAASADTAMAGAGSAAGEVRQP